MSFDFSDPYVMEIFILNLLNSVSRNSLLFARDLAEVQCKLRSICIFISDNKKWKEENRFFEPISWAISNSWKKHTYCNSNLNFQISISIWSILEHCNIKLAFRKLNSKKCFLHTLKYLHSVIKKSCNHKCCTLFACVTYMHAFIAPSFLQNIMKCVYL